MESALIWAFQPQLTNEIRGPMNECIRPAHTLHQSLAGFDSRSAAYWSMLAMARRADGTTVGIRVYLSRRRAPVEQTIGAPVGRRRDRLILKSHGYVGIARVAAESVPVADFRYRGRRLSGPMLKQPGLLRHAEDAARSEYLVGVKWIRQMPAAEAKFRRRAGLFTTQLVVAGLARQLRTLRFLNEAFQVNIERLASEI